MNVTFEILLGDLVRWRPSVERGGASLSRGFRYSLPAQGQVLGASDVLYIAKGSEVVGLVDCLDGCSLPISLLCVGFPPSPPRLTFSAAQLSFSIRTNRLTALSFGNARICLLRMRKGFRAYPIL